MSKASSSFIPLLLVIFLSIFFFLSPNFFSQEVTGSSNTLKEISIKRFTSVGNTIAHAAFVEDAIIMNESPKLNEIITSLRRDEPEMTFIYFVDNTNKIIASSNPNMIGKTYDTDILTSGESIVREKNGTYEGGFSITIGQKRIGAIYFEAKPEIVSGQLAASPNPIVLAVGIVVAFIIFFITYSSNRNLEKKLVADLNRRKEATISPQVQALKKEKEETEKGLEEITEKMTNLQKEYATKKAELESNPLFQSVEKLKTVETETLKKLETLKEQKTQLSKEVESLTQKREEIRSALEAEKKEESILHEKLALIKKKILRLETPEK
ncbi:hypothetical protein AMJ52_05830 [candidate division TA06 bacterium DG_78]|uniref:Single cache domain-containing protein n=1 Tax=candidate division TA06 bacterium DG_78 TaxID=1703772 RepID=A0A0S7YD05_UNCT6|nr:MAG: hypothetical protein AMJ52_05830 [candidate division TA06 bacterium DG_78]